MVASFHRTLPNLIRMWYVAREDRQLKLSHRITYSISGVSTEHTTRTTLTLSAETCSTVPFENCLSSFAPPQPQEMNEVFNDPPFINMSPVRSRVVLSPSPTSSRTCRQVSRSAQTSLCPHVVSQHPNVHSVFGSPPGTLRGTAHGCLGTCSSPCSAAEQPSSPRPAIAQLDDEDHAPRNYGRASGTSNTSSTRARLYTVKKSVRRTILR
jgi:hypothetical protein